MSALLVGVLMQSFMSNNDTLVLLSGAGGGMERDEWVERVMGGVESGGVVNTTV